MGLLYYICCDQDKTLYELGKAGWYSFEEFKISGKNVYVITDLNRFIYLAWHQFQGTPRYTRIASDIFDKFNNKEIYIVYDADDSYDEKIDAGYKVIGSIYRAE